MGARAIGLYRSVLEAQSVNPFAGLPPPGGSRQGNQARRGDIRRVRRRRPNRGEPAGYNRYLPAVPHRRGSAHLRHPCTGLDLIPPQKLRDLLNCASCLVNRAGTLRTHITWRRARPVPPSKARFLIVAAHRANAGSAPTAAAGQVDMVVNGTKRPRKFLGVAARRRVVDHRRLIWPGYRDRPRWVLVRRRCRWVRWRLRRSAGRLGCSRLLSKGCRN